MRPTNRLHWLRSGRRSAEEARTALTEALANWICTSPSPDIGVSVRSGHVETVAKKVTKSPPIGGAGKTPRH